MSAARRNWLAVACAEHVRRGRELGIMQVCHGKAAPLRRIQAGDHVTFYSPSLTLGGREKFQSFTALGVVRDEQIYQVDMGGGFCPFRRDVDWMESIEVSIHVLRERLDLTTGKINWGYALRYGLLTLSEHDMALIAEAMAPAFSCINWV